MYASSMAPEQRHPLTVQGIPCSLCCFSPEPVVLLQEYIQYIAVMYTPPSVIPLLCGHLFNLFSPRKCGPKEIYLII